MPSARPTQFALTAPGALRLYSTDELMCLPPPTWLVDDIIPTGPQGSFNVIYGPSGAGKTFIALDLAMSVGAGIPWQGHPTQQGLVAYVSAEGTAGLRQRIMAWLQGTGLDSSDVHIAWLMESVPIYNASEELDVLLSRFDELHEQPALVIIDTLARCFEGNENETEDMANFIKGCDRIRTECGSAVLAVHHMNATEGRERGNGSLRAATDMMMQVMPGTRAHGRDAQGLMTMTCSKQKEALPFAPGIGRLVPVAESGSVRVVVNWMPEAEGHR